MEERKERGKKKIVKEEERVGGNEERSREEKREKEKEDRKEERKAEISSRLHSSTTKSDPFLII